MALDDVVKGFKNVRAITEVARALNEGQNIPAPALDNFVQYVAATEPTNGPALAQSLATLASQDRHQLSGYVNNCYAREIASFTKVMDKNYKPVVRALDKSLEGFALQLPEKSKAFLVAEQQMAQEDIIGALETCAGEFKYKENAEAVRGLAKHPEVAKHFLKLYVNFKKMQFLEKYAKRNKKGEVVLDKKGEMVIDRDKLRDYAAKMVGSYKDTDKESVYMQLAGSYSAEQGKKKK